MGTVDEGRPPGLSEPAAAEAGSAGADEAYPVSPMTVGSVSDDPSPTKPDEETMKALMRQGDHEGVVALLASVPKAGVNVRMINMAFSARISTGTAVDAAAVEALQLCAAHNIKP